MDYQSLIGKTFTENELYETILFDIEQNFENYFSEHIHIYFEHLGADKILVKDLVLFADSNSAYLVRREFIEKKAWFEVTYDSKTAVKFMMCRLNRSGKFSIIWKEHTHHQKMGRLGWLDEYPQLKKELTPEEIRKGCLELLGLFEQNQEVQKLQSKKAV